MEGGVKFLLGDLPSGTNRAVAIEIGDRGEIVRFEAAGLHLTTAESEELRAKVREALAS